MVESTELVIKSLTCEETKMDWVRMPVLRYLKWKEFAQHLEEMKSTHGPFSFAAAKITNSNNLQQRDEAKRTFRSLASRKPWNTLRQQKPNLQSTSKDPKVF